jgi:hypothetical protein
MNPETILFKGQEKQFFWLCLWLPLHTYAGGGKKNHGNQDVGFKHISIWMQQRKDPSIAIQIELKS